jgi:Ca2+-binding EF-hand superfamily protein
MTAALIVLALSTGGTVAYAASADRGGWTRDQAVERSEAMFDRMDLNDDGVLDGADREARLAARFARLDSDGDGVLTEREWMAQVERTERRGSRGMAARRALDADGDRSVSREEFAAMALARFARADADGDGVVTRAERRDGRPAR